MNEQRNLIIAIVLSALILFGFQWMFPSPTPTQSTSTSGQTVGAPPAPGVQGAAPVAAVQLTPEESRAAAISASKRILVETPRLKGSINLQGARFDDIILRGYREEVEPDSPEITLLSPNAGPKPYYAEFGWVSADAGLKLPNGDSLWQADNAATLTAGNKVNLTWDNGQGLRFIRTISVDENYMFNVEQRVENYGNTAVSLHPYGYVARFGRPKTEDFYILHEGPLGVIDGTLTEHQYGDLAEEGPKSNKTMGGWIGITDKYWLTAIIPAQNQEVTARFIHNRSDNTDRYQVDVTGVATTLQPGASASDNFNFFAGAKIVTLLDEYEEKLGVERFSFAVDFGWFWFLTKPFFYMLHWFYGVLGNMGLAILAITVVIKAVMFPLANKSYASMSRMKLLQPQLKSLQERFAADKPRLQQEMMALYKKEGVNPVSGCLPMLVQIPIFFALYKVLFVTIEMRHAPFFGWIKDLSAPDPTNIWNLFGLIPWDAALIPSFLYLGIWPIIMGATMWLQQKLNPAPQDPVQARVFMFLPIIFTFLLAPFAAGLVIYWAWNNALSILQQWMIMRKHGVK